MWKLTSLGPFTLAKTKIQKTWVFCCTVYTARKTHNIRGFWHEKRMREKTWISYLCFGNGAHARLLSTFDRTRVVRITSRAAVGWFRWRSRTTWPKTRIIPARLERAFTLAKTSEISAEFKKITLWRWVFRFGFFGVFRGSCLATFNENPNARKIRVFWCQCKRHSCCLLVFMEPHWSHKFCRQHTKHQCSSSAVYYMYMYQFFL